MSDMDISLSYLEGLKDLSTLDEFVSQVSAEHLRIGVKERKAVPTASVEWLAMTAIVVFVTRSYFDGFFKEMAKDHYQLLKNGIKALGNRLIGPSGPKLTRITAGGKTIDEGEYSRVFSVMVETRDGRTAKLLLRTGASTQEVSESVDVFMDLFDSGKPALEDIVPSDDAWRISGDQVILLAFNFQSRSIEVVDPVPKRK